MLYVYYIGFEEHSSGRVHRAQGIVLTLASTRSVILEDDTSPDKQDKAARKPPDQAKTGKDPPTPTGRGPPTAILPVRTDSGSAVDAAAGARALGAAYPGSPVSALSDVRGLL